MAMQVVMYHVSKKPPAFYGVDSDEWLDEALLSEASGVREPSRYYGLGLTGLHVIGGKKRYYLTAPFSGVYLTEQEVRCIVGFLCGLSNKEIAKIVDCAEVTVSTYIVSVARKLYCSSKRQMRSVMEEARLLQFLQEIDPNLNAYIR